MAQHPNRTIRALYDLRAGLAQWRLWRELAFRDLRRSYYGSFFGQIWIALTLGIFVAIIGNVYTIMFSMDGREYVPFLCSGLISWRLITNLINDGGTVFLGSGGYIKGFSLPMSVFIYKTLVKNFIVYLHYFSIYILVMLIYSIPVTPQMLLLLPGIVIVELNGLWVIALLGVICTRFRDVQQMISSLVVLLFFVTPVFWPEQLIVEYREIIVFNPFYHLLELMRAPLLGRTPEPLSWLVGLGSAIAGMAVTLPIFARFRSRIVFWL